MKILLIEDHPDDIATFKSSLELHPEVQQIHAEYASQVEELFGKLDNSFDGIILDLKLHSNEGAGIDALSFMLQNMYRIPTVVFTATPDALPNGYPIIGPYKKGEKRYADVLNELFSLYRCGISKVLGGRGEFEVLLGKFYSKVISRHLDVWRARGATDSARTEKALLRFAANHIIKAIDFDSESVFPEEVYVFAESDQTVLTTGSILRRMSDDGLFLILNPACDLVLHEEKRKAVKLLSVQIDPIDSEITDVVSGTKPKERKIQKLEQLSRNHGGEPKHYLPPSTLFPGGFAQFRKIELIDFSDVGSAFTIEHAQVAAPFIRDIQFRFSSFLGRQGQPEIEVLGFFPS